ncbi:MAG: hypothetical protein ACP5N1_01435 [Candidatus Woesearchaeota archaeon]
MINAEKINLLIVDNDDITFSTQFEKFMNSKESYFYNKKKKVLLKKAKKILLGNFDPYWNNLETSELEKLLLGTTSTQGVFSKYLHGLKINYFDKNISYIEKEIDIMTENPFAKIINADNLIDAYNNLANVELVVANVYINTNHYTANPCILESSGVLFKKVLDTYNLPVVLYIYPEQQLKSGLKNSMIQETNMIPGMSDFPSVYLHNNLEMDLNNLYTLTGKIAVGIQYGFYKANINGITFVSPDPSMSIIDAKEAFQKILNAKFGEEEILSDSKLKSLYNYI